MRSLILAVLLCLAAPNLAQAQLSNFGFFVTALKPAPGGLGFEVAYQYTDDIRITVGFGSIVWWSTVGVGAQYQFSSHGFSPYIGAHITHSNFIDLNSDDSSLLWDTDDVTDGDDGLGGSIDIGIDWETGPGFTVGIGGSLLINSFIDNKVLPHAYIGWMF